MERIISIYKILDKSADNEINFLNYRNHFELLIGVILSAQTTDLQVNSVLPALFKEFPSDRALAEGDITKIRRIIKPVGFYNVKSEKIKRTAEIIHNKYNGKVPSEMEKLLELPGVGRKSANVIRGACFNLPAIIVDTHFSRVVTRIGLTKHTDPEKIELELADSVPDEYQYRFSMLVNKHGRDFCKARSPQCEQCEIKKYCDFYKNSVESL